MNVIRRLARDQTFWCLVILEAAIVASIAILVSR